MATSIVLHRSALWNPALPSGGRHSYTQVDDRKFHAERSGGMYTIYQVGDDGITLGWETARDEHGLTDLAKLAAITSAAFVATAFNRPQVRLAIQLRLAGKTEDEIRVAVHLLGSAGTGRNSPGNIARRRAWHIPIGAPVKLTPRPKG